MDKASPVRVQAEILLVVHQEGREKGPSTATSSPTIHPAAARDLFLQLLFKSFQVPTASRKKKTPQTPDPSLQHQPTLALLQPLGPPGWSLTRPPLSPRPLCLPGALPLSLIHVSGQGAPGVLTLAEGTWADFPLHPSGWNQHRILFT